jgi:N-acetylmuramoyl-L-alanine amidase
MKITQTPSPNFNKRPLSIDSIIIHYTDMVSAEAALAWLINPISQVSAHYLIEESGQIYHMVGEEQRAWHAGESYWQGRSNLNDCSIGIELANPGHSHGYTPFPEAQISALVSLCLKIKKRWNIPKDRILGHSDIAPKRKQDPGHLFPWELLAKEGLGMWPGEGYLSRTELNLNLIPLLLSTLGYDITSPPHALIAFQRHFQPHKMDGFANQETYTLLQGLLKSEDMLI